MNHRQKFAAGFVVTSFLLGFSACQMAVSVPEPSSVADSATSMPSPSARPDADPASAPQPPAPATIRPRPVKTPTAGSGAIPSDNSSMSCPVAPASARLHHPTELAVTSDGTTVYALNSRCQQKAELIKLAIQSDCESLAGHGKPSQLFRLSQNRPPQLLGNELLGTLVCKMGHDLEIDQAENLYFANDYHAQITRLTPAFEQTLLSKGPNDSFALNPNTYFSSFHEPSHLRLQGKELYFELSVSDSTNDYRLRQLDLQTDSYRDRMASQSGIDHKIYTAYDQHVYELVGLTSPPQSLIPNLSSVSYIRPASLLIHEPVPPKTRGVDLLDERQPSPIPIKMSPNQQIVPYELRAVSPKRAYLSDTESHQIWVLTIEDKLATLKVFVGSGQAGYQDGKGMRASFNTPTALSLDAAGNLFVADTGNHAIRKITPDGIVTTFYKEAEL